MKLFTNPINQYLSKSVLVVLLSFASYQFTQAQCVANFTHSVNDSTKTVTFTNTSTGGAGLRSWWDYDGVISMSTNTSPVFTFQNPGWHYVCLNISRLNDSTCRSKKCDSIFINKTSPCVANWFFYGDTNGMMWYNATQSLGANLVYFWSYDDGSPISVEPYAVTGHQFHRKGIHNVCLTVVNSLDTSCKSTSCKTISNSSPCSGAFYSYTDTITDTTQFIPQYSVPNTSYTWTFDDGTGTITTTTIPLKHKFNTPGPHVVCLTVTNTADSCTATSCDTIMGSPSTGINTINNVKRNYFSTFPNPVENVLNIIISQPVTENAYLSIYNSIGQKVMEQKLEPSHSERTVKLNTESLPEGIYVIELKGSDMKQVAKFYK
ncbi:MAG: PKD domain-containing protein [Bacteroidota bacterium]